jgi:hypothetical protein
MSVLDEWSPTPASEAFGAEPASLTQLESPFLQTPETTAEALREAGEGVDLPRISGLFESSLLSEQSPFLETPSDGAREAVDREADAYRQLVSELYDQQLDEAIYELAQGAAAAAEAQDEREAFGPDPEAAARAYLEPVRETAEAMLDHLSAELERIDAVGMPEADLEVFLNQLEPPERGEFQPEAEDFLGRIWDGVKRVAAGAVNLAKKGIAAVGRILPINFILNKLKGLVRPLLGRVLQFAMSKLPPGLRPAAMRVARMLGAVGETASDEELSLAVGGGTPATEAEGIQEEFNSNVASLLFAADEAGAEQIVAEAGEAVGVSGESAVTDLAQARERFVAEVSQLPRGGDATPALENFLPAVMAVLPLVKMGVRIIGRQNVVNFIAKLLGGLIGPVVGPEVATPLSQAIADKGLGLLGLETAPPAGASERLAEHAIAATVEDTVHRLAGQGEQVFEDSNLLEAAVTEAFQESAAAHFPPEYVKPELREVAKADGVWRLAPRAHWYRRYSRVFDVEITPQAAAKVISFGGQTLAAFMRQRYGITGPVKAKVHLYEAIPGTTIAKIARLERGVPGLGGPGAQYWTKLHPLTPGVAGILLAEPGLGRSTEATYLQTRRRIAVGQRFYYVELPEPRGRDVTPSKPYKNGKVQPTRLSQVNVVFDIPRGQARVCVYLSEADAQSVAGRLRTQRNALAAIVLIRRVYDASLRSLFDPARASHLKVIREDEQFLAAAGRAVGGKIVQYLAEKLLAWVEQAIAEYLQEKAEEFVRRADDPANGVTIVVSLQQPAAFTVLRVVLGLQSPSLGLPSGLNVLPVRGVRTQAGFYFA